MSDMDKEICKEHPFVIDNKKIVVYPGESSNRPVVYLNTFAEEGGLVYKELHNIGCPDFTLVAISGLDWEHKTRNPYLKTVQECTEEIKTFYMEKGIDTVFQSNPGNHFKDAVQRTAAGIAWILER